MNIFVDESGTFRSATVLDSWCVVAAYASPESDRRHVEKIVQGLSIGRPFGYEVKLNDLAETEYFDFLGAIGRLDGVAFGVAVDVGLHNEANITAHRNAQAMGIVKDIDKMIHQSMRDSLVKLSAEVKNLPIQLYTQLICQTTLFYEVIRLSILYFVQRRPQTLREFRWRVDQKDKFPTRYEKTFRALLPGILQTMSIEDPMIFVQGWAYGCLKRYEFAEDERPNYLTKQYGIEDADGHNIGKIVGENFRFVDSTKVPGVRVADLLASGFRKLLRGGFVDNDMAARLLGSLLILRAKGDQPLKLISLDRGATVSPVTTARVKLMHRHGRPMLI